MEITTEQLKSAFKRTNLWRMGWSFEKAVQYPHIRLCLTRLAEREQQKEPNAPKQGVLI